MPRNVWGGEHAKWGKKEQAYQRQLIQAHTAAELWVQSPFPLAKGRAYRRAIKAFPLTLSGMENYCGARHIPDEILPCACGWHQADLYFFLSTLSHGWEQSLPAGSGFIVSEPGRALVSLEWGVLLRLNGFHAQCWPVIWGKLHKLVIPAQPVYTVSFFLLL